MTWQTRSWSNPATKGYVQQGEAKPGINQTKPHKKATLSGGFLLLIASIKKSIN
jgi:hypothetical protein